MSFLSLTTDRVTTAYPEQPLIVAPDATIATVLQLMKTQRSGNVLVCEDGPGGGGPECQVLGIFTERDAMKCMAEGADLAGPVSGVMTADPTVVGAKTTVGEAIELMAQHGFRHLPIVDASGAPTGVAAVRGIVHYLVDHFPNTIYTLPPDPGKSPQSREGA
ncbi:MAG: CBS domain-containing protein [Planctomycetales bacterium]|nr:CBS domain-containing protein [Planctomycetales bacterium]